MNLVVPTYSSYVKVLNLLLVSRVDTIERRSLALLATVSLVILFLLQEAILCCHHYYDQLGF